MSTKKIISTTTINLDLNKTKLERTKTGSETVATNEVKVTDKVLIPRNVVDNEYFELAVQFHCYQFIDRQLSSKIVSLNNKEWETVEEEEKITDSIIEIQTQKTRLTNSFENWKNELSELVESVEDTLTVFETDSFAKCFAMFVTQFKGETVSTGDGLEKIEVRFTGSEISQEKLSSLVKDLGCTGLTDDYKKKVVKEINQFANDNFATDGGELYKNINYNFKYDLLVEELFSRSKKALKINTKGKGIDNLRIKGVEVAYNLFALCLHSQGLPLYNGEKVQKYYAGEVTSTKTLVFKKKETK